MPSPLTSHPASGLPDALRGDVHAQLLSPFLPHLARWREELFADLHRVPATLVDRFTIEEQAATRLARQWLWMITPPLVLELHRARERGELSGASPEARWDSFVACLPDLDLGAYPELHAQLEDRARQHREATLETLAAFRADVAALREAFFAGQDPGPLVDLGARAGDLHADGRSVAILGFASGARVVYKPRSLAVDARFQSLLAWCNAHGAPEPFRVLRVLDRGDHGWMEWVEPAPCADEAALARHHVRLGALLAVLHLVRAVDLHFENLIAAGEHPVAIDLETLFHPTPPSVAARPAEERILNAALDESVLRVGMLPFRVGDEAGLAEADLSGLAAGDERRTPDAVIQWENVGRDDMRAVRATLSLGGTSHRPAVAGRTADPTDFVAEMSDGFARMSGAILGNRDRFAAELERFAEDRVRVILRPTRVYGLLLDACWHPDLLMTRERRDAFFARLEVASEAPELAATLPTEIRDLEAGDVPLFTARAGGRDLWSSRGERFADFFPESALEAALGSLARWTARDIEREAWLVRASLAMDALNRDRGRWRTHAPVLPDRAPDPRVQRARLVAEAERIGEWFERMAVGDGSRATWVALDFRAMQWSVDAAALDLYSGTPGFVLFLAQLGVVTGHGEWTALARRGLRALREQLARDGRPVRGGGLFQGAGGIVFTLAHLAALWEDRALVRAAEEWLPAIEDSIEGDEELDVVAGGAGRIAALLALERAGGTARAIDVAARCARHLVARAERHPHGRIWRIALSGDEPATGFAHGASGIAAALLTLVARTGDDEARTCALEALRAESAVLAPRLAKWSGETLDETPSLPRYAEKTLSTSWCHGLAGLALARLTAAPHDAGLGAEGRRFLAIAGERGFGRSHCLCHGDLGNLDILGRAARSAGDGILAQEVARLTAATLEGAARTGWRCGTMSEVETPGLMNGLAGIGWGLLGLAVPERVPSILALDPPAPRDSTA